MNNRSSHAHIPNEMQAVRLLKYGEPLTTLTVPVPRPGPGQVLIRMAAAPINPSDMSFIKGTYVVAKPLPVTPGLEGSGTVVAAGAGLLPRILLGKRVACSSAGNSTGTWAEYMVATASNCFPLSRRLSLEQGATLIVNPMTALALVDIAHKGGHAAIVNNAAAGAAGRMIFRLAEHRGIPVINIVRRPENVRLLSSIGAKHVLDSSCPDFLTEFGKLCSALSATLILDPVSGDLGSQLLQAAPKRSRLILYGYRSGKDVNVGMDLITGDKSVEGFYLGNYVARNSVPRTLLDIRRVQRLAGHVLQTEIQKRVTLADANQAIQLSHDSPTAGKVLFVMEPSATHQFTIEGGNLGSLC